MKEIKKKSWWILSDELTHFHTKFLGYGFICLDVLPLQFYRLIPFYLFLLIIFLKGKQIYTVRKLNPRLLQITFFWKKKIPDRKYLIQRNPSR